MPPRRSHKKSRTGCKRCKARKIKCDEVHPRCGNCSRHGVPCDFENPDVVREIQAALSTSGVPPSSTYAAGPHESVHRRPSYAPSPHSTATVSPIHRQPSQPLSSGLNPISRLTELRLMHHYTHYTHKTLSVAAPDLTNLWGTSVPSIAFAGNQHLMDAILAVSALHLRSICPNDKELIYASHAYMTSCINAYSSSLNAGIDANNAANLFLTSTLIAFQSTATRIFTKDESLFSKPSASCASADGSPAGSTYQPPLAWFHSFQGVKTIVAASWPWLKQNEVILSLIDAQPVLNLNFSRAGEGFFGHLLSDLDDELASLDASSGSDSASLPGSGSNGAGGSDIVTSTRQAYQHAVATLNWAHARPGNGSLAFPATVSKRFVQLIEERQPRALAILAAFFALLKVLDHVWWLQGMARREVLGIVSLFNSDYFGPDLERKWWPHLEWAVRVALYDTGQSGNNFIPAEVWGSSWPHGDDGAHESEIKFTNHIEMYSELANPASPLPVPPENTLSRRQDALVACMGSSLVDGPHWLTLKGSFVYAFDG